MAITASRQSRSLLNSGWNSLGQAEQAWLRFVQTVEALGVMHGNAEVGPKARDIAQGMHEFREVLTTWTKD